MDEFRKELLICIDLCSKELQNRINGVDGESTVEQLETVVLPELKEVLSIIDSGQLPEREERYLNSFAKAFTVWGWDMQNPTKLFTTLTQLNNNYEEL